MRSGKAGRRKAGRKSEEWKEKHLVCENLLGYRSWDFGRDLGSAAEEEPKGSFQQSLDFSLIPWHRNSNPALLWARKIPFPSPLAGILQIGDKPSYSRRLLGVGRGSDLSGNGSSSRACGNFNFHGKPAQAFQLSWRFSGIPVMFKSILCLISW